MKYADTKKETKNKVFVIVVALIFLGSIGGAMLYSTGTEKGGADLPASRIIPGISDAEKERVLFGSVSNPADRYVLITLRVPKSCDIDCNRAKMIAQQMVSAFEPAVYLDEEPSESQSLDMAVSMESFRDKKELSAFNQTAIEDFICENSVYRLNECVVRKINFGASDGNETEKNESIGTGGRAGSENSGSSAGSNTSRE